MKDKQTSQKSLFNSIGSALFFACLSLCAAILFSLFFGRIFVEGRIAAEEGISTTSRGVVRLAYNTAFKDLDIGVKIDDSAAVVRKESRPGFVRFIVTKYNNAFPLVRPFCGSYDLSGSVEGVVLYNSAVYDLIPPSEFGPEAYANIFDLETQEISYSVPWDDLPVVLQSITADQVYGTAPITNSDITYIDQSWFDSIEGESISIQTTSECAGIVGAAFITPTLFGIIAVAGAGLQMRKRREV